MWLTVCSYTQTFRVWLACWNAVCERPKWKLFQQGVVRHPRLQSRGDTAPHWSGLYSGIWHCTRRVTSPPSLSSVPMGIPLQVTSEQHPLKEEGALQLDPTLKKRLPCQQQHLIKWNLRSVAFGKVYTEAYVTILQISVIGKNFSQCHGHCLGYCWMGHYSWRGLNISCLVTNWKPTLKVFE